MEYKQLLLDFDSISRSIHLLTPDEIFANADQQLLLRLSEDNRLERKSSGISPKDLSEYVCMWANTQPHGGIIVVGQSDDGELIGLSSQPQKRINDIEKTWREFVPDAHCETKRVQFIKSNNVEDFVILLRVEYRENKVVETNSGHSFIRRGDSKNKLTEEEKRELAMDKGQVHCELEPCNLSYPEDFDMDLVRKFASRIISEKGLKQEYTAIKILCNKKLGKIVNGNFIPNIACALLFANDPRDVIPGSIIRFQRFEGTTRETGERRNVIKDIKIEGRLPELIAETDQIINSQIKDFSRLGPKGKFFTAPEYPRAAWYEALVNACVHRSYNLKNMNIFVRMFDDRIEIESPGAFPPLVTPENIYDIHHRRNYFLMEAMSYMDLVKCENEGTRRMRDEMRAMELPDPEFAHKEIGNTLVRVTLRNNLQQRRLWIDKDAVDLVGTAIFAQLDDRQKRCVNFCSEHGKITVADAARLHAVDWKTGKKILQSLVDFNLLEWVSKRPRDSKAHYVLKK